MISFGGIELPNPDYPTWFYESNKHLCFIEGVCTPEVAQTIKEIGNIPGTLNIFSVPFPDCQIVNYNMFHRDDGKIRYSIAFKSPTSKMKGCDNNG